MNKLAYVQPVLTIPLRFNAGSYSKKFTDAFSLTGNLASLAAYKTFAAGISIEKPFMLTNLKQGVLAAGVPVSGGGLGVQVSYLSAGGCTQTEAGIAYAKKLGGIDIAAGLNYNRIMIAAYGSASTLVITLANSWHVTDDMHVALQLYNPVGGKIGSQQKLSYLYKGGIGYEVSAQVLVSAELSKEENKPAAVSVGLQYYPVAQCIIQAGIDGGKPYLVAGLQRGNLRISMQVTLNTQLGASPALSLQYFSLKHSRNNEVL